MIHRRKNFSSFRPKYFRKTISNNNCLAIPENSIEVLPENVQEIIKSPNISEKCKQFLAIKAQMHSGPIPHPDILRGYDLIVPGAGDRLISMVETAQKTDIKLKEQDQSWLQKSYDEDRKNQHEVTRTGQNYALALSIAFILFSLALAFMGYPGYGFMACGSVLVTLALAFLGNEPLRIYTESKMGKDVPEKEKKEDSLKLPENPNTP